MKFAVVNLGCKVNRVESDEIAALLSRCAVDEAAEASAPAESEISQADIVVINTCTVTGEAEKKTRKTVRRVLRENNFCKIVVTGCASEINPSFFADLSNRINVVPKADVCEYLLQICGHVDNASSSNTACGAYLRMGEAFNTRVGIKVQDGCNNACTYCIVHIARGQATSTPVAQVIDECVSYAKCGVKELVLTGINLGSYVSARGGKTYQLHDLLAELLAATDGICNGQPSCRFRLSSIEPNDLDSQTIALIAKSNGRICCHLHLPLQSGSTDVLRAMARKYTAQQYMQLVCELRKQIPNLSLTTDIIVGFPGETEEDFEQTLDMARACEFSKIHVFPYSKREGTPAAARTDQVSENIKAQRARVLRELSDELRMADYASRIGNVENAVVEKNGICMTDSYYEVPCSEKLPIGTFVQVVIPSLDEHDGISKHATIVQ